MSKGFSDQLTSGGVPWEIRWTADDHCWSHIYGPLTAWMAVVPTLPALLTVVDIAFEGTEEFWIGGANPNRAT